MLIPTTLLAGGYGEHPAGLGRSSAVTASCISAPAAGTGCWSSFAAQLRGCQDVSVSGKTQAGFSEGAEDLVGGWEADSFSSCPWPAAKRPLSPPRVTNSQPVSKVLLSFLWCLAGLTHSEVRGLLGQRQKPRGRHPVSQLLSTGAQPYFPSCTMRDRVGRAGNLRCCCCPQGSLQVSALASSSARRWS